MSQPSHVGRPIRDGVATVGGTQRAVTLREPAEAKHFGSMADPCVTVALGDETGALTVEAARSLAYQLLLASGIDSAAARVHAPYPQNDQPGASRKGIEPAPPAWEDDPCFVEQPGDVRLTGQKDQPEVER
jgi:hypothetical protein